MLKFKVPKHWDDLLDILAFDEYTGPLVVERDCVIRLKAEGDEPYGTVLEMELCSGQANYWYTINIWEGGELLGQSEPQHCITAGPDSVDFADSEGRWVTVGYDVELV
jgi:hypothetical protein